MTKEFSLRVPTKRKKSLQYTLYAVVAGLSTFIVASIIGYSRQYEKQRTYAKKRSRLNAAAARIRNDKISNRVSANILAPRLLENPIYKEYETNKKKTALDFAISNTYSNYINSNPDQRF